MAPISQFISSLCFRVMFVTRPVTCHFLLDLPYAILGFAFSSGVFLLDPLYTIPSFAYMGVINFSFDKMLLNLSLVCWKILNYHTRG